MQKQGTISITVTSGTKNSKKEDTYVVTGEGWLIVLTRKELAELSDCVFAIRGYDPEDEEL